jgi:hypothetical protein
MEFKFNFLSLEDLKKVVRILVEVGGCTLAPVPYM